MEYYLNILIKRFLLGWCLVVALALKAKCQSNVETQNVDVTYNKTSTIVFPAIIKSVDRGSRDVLAQKAKGVENVLQVKAARRDFPQTNLTVITDDGVLHHFTVNYSEQPATLTLIAVPLTQPPADPLIFPTELTENDIENYSVGIAKDKRRILGVNESRNKVSFTLLGIYVKDDIMFYHFRVINRSNIDYDIDFLKFYIRDKVRIKRTASQEIEMKPMHIYGNDKEVKGNSSTDIVSALQKFTIPEAKYLQVELFERNGGRNLNLNIKNKTIVNARLLE